MQTTVKHEIGQTMKDHYERVWRDGDAWSFETSDFEQARYDHQLALLADKRSCATLEIGCGSGCLTRRIAQISDRVVAIDISTAAIERARSQLKDLHDVSVDLRSANIMEFNVESEGPWDLIVFSEAIYCVGWLYPMFDVAFLVARLFDSLRPGGRLLLANTYGENKDWLLRSWLIDTYRDLCRNVGFQVKREELFRGNKDGVDLKVLMTLFIKPNVPVPTFAGT